MAKVSVSRSGAVSIDGNLTPYFIEKGDLTSSGRVSWYLANLDRCHRQVALFHRRKDVIKAIEVFFEGQGQGAEESGRAYSHRVLQLCLETGSSDVLGLAKTASWPIEPGTVISCKKSGQKALKTWSALSWENIGAKSPDLERIRRELGERGVSEWQGWRLYHPAHKEA